MIGICFITIIVYWITSDTLKKLFSGGYLLVDLYDIFALILLILLIVFIFVAIKKLKIGSDIVRAGIETTATILEIEKFVMRSQFFCVLTYEYNLPSGEKHIKKVNVDKVIVNPDWKEGDKILIRYNPNKPKESSIYF